MKLSQHQQFLIANFAIEIGIPKSKIEFLFKESKDKSLNMRIMG